LESEGGNLPPVLVEAVLKPAPTTLDGIHENPSMQNNNTHRPTAL